MTPRCAAVTQGRAIALPEIDEPAQSDATGGSGRSRRRAWSPWPSLDVESAGLQPRKVLVS